MRSFEMFGRIALEGAFLEDHGSAPLAGCAKETRSAAICSPGPEEVRMFGGTQKV
jgi:hypothetical protein